MDSSSEDDALMVAITAGLLIRRRLRRQKRRMWVRPLLQMRTRQAFHNLIGEIRLSDPEKHFNYLRMSKETFDLLLEKV